MQTKCIDFYMQPFIATRLLTYYLLTYYFSFWFLLNISWNSIQYHASIPKCYHQPYTPCMPHCMTSRPGNTSSTGPDLWSSSTTSSPDLILVYCKTWGIIQQRVCRLTLTKWISGCWLLKVALTTALLTMQLTSGQVIFNHVYTHILDTGATGVTVTQY